MEDEEETEAEVTDLDSNETEDTDEETAYSASEKCEETDKDSSSEEKLAGKSTVG